VDICADGSSPDGTINVSVGKTERGCSVRLCLQSALASSRTCRDAVGKIRGFAGWFERARDWWRVVRTAKGRSKAYTLPRQILVIIRRWRRCERLYVRHGFIDQGQEREMTAKMASRRVAA